MGTRIYLSLPGATGKVKDRKYRGWIDVTSASGPNARGVSGGGAASRAAQKEVWLTKDSGPATVAIFRLSMEGVILPVARIVFVGQEAGGTPYLEIILETVMVASFSTSGLEVATFSLAYEKITYIHR